MATNAEKGDGHRNSEVKYRKNNTVLSQLGSTSVDKNLRNMTQTDLNKKIYQIIPIKYLFEIIENEQIYLKKVIEWDDPYENFFLRSKFTLNGKEVSNKNVSEHIYGQCWSLFKDSDAMWRIYSRDEKSVRITTTIRKLYDVVYNNSDMAYLSYIGNIKYKQKKQLFEWIKKMPQIDMGNIQQYAVDSLFYKRNNFSHEKEFRVIFINDSECADLKFVNYKINALDFIDAVAFDPRAKEEYVDEQRERLKAKGFSLGKVSKSSLYKFKPLKVELL